MGGREGGGSRRGSLGSYGVIMIFVITALFPSMVAAFHVLGKYDTMNQLSQDEIATHQLRRIFAISSVISVQESELVIWYQGKEHTLSIKNNHIYLSPGTQIFYTEIDDGYFSKERGFVILSYRRDEKWVSRVLIHE